MQFDQLKRRRELIMMLGGMAASSVACPFAVDAQPGERMRHVGLREGHTASDPVVKMKIDRFVSGEMSRQKIPGMAVAVVKNGEAVVAKGYGFANLEDQVPVTTHSIFQSGSVGKQFTAAAIVHLEEHGKLRLDDNIARYLPPTKARWGSITVRQLLTHTSGIPEYEDEVDWRRDYSERQLAELVGLLRPRSTPGQKFEYSNSGYLLLERALAYGPLAALDDRPRPGKGAYDHAGSEGLAGVAGVRQGQRARLSARVVDDTAFGPPCAPARTGGGARMSQPFGPGHGVQDPRPRGYQAAQGALLSGKSRRRVRAENGGGSVRLSRGPGPEKSRRQAEQAGEAGGDRLLRRETGNPGHRDDGAGFATVPGVHAPSRGIMSTNAMARSACWPGLICSLEPSTLSLETVTAAASSSNSSSFSIPPIRPAPPSS